MPDIPDDQVEGILAELLLQPGQILRCAGAAEIVVDGHVFAAFQQPVDKIRADESGPAGDKIISRHDLLQELLQVHATGRNCECDQLDWIAPGAWHMTAGIHNHALDCYG